MTLLLLASLLKNYNIREEIRDENYGLGNTVFLEPIAVKKQIIKSATEAACMILRIDDVIASSGAPGGMPGQ